MPNVRSQSRGDKRIGLVYNSSLDAFEAIDFARIDDIEDLLRSGINVSVTGASTINVNVTGGNLNILNEVEVSNTTGNAIPVSFAPNQTVGVSTLPAVNIAANQNVGVSSLPAVNIAANQNVGVSSLPAVTLAANQNVNVETVTTLPAVNIAAGQNVGVSSLPAVTLAANQNVNVGTVTTLPAVNIAANQNVGVSSLPAVNIAANQNVGVSSLPAVNIAANQNVGITGSVAITNTDIVSLKNNFSNVIFSEENSPSGIVVYQANLNKDLDNVTIYTEKSDTISNFTPSGNNGTVLEGNANRKELYIQNLATGSLHVKYGSSASATSFNFVLAGNTSNNAGDGGSLSDQSYTGIVSVFGLSTPINYISWERS